MLQKQLIELLIPDVFSETQSSFIDLLLNFEKNPENVIEKSVLGNGFYGIEKHTDPDFKTYLSLDLLTQGFISKFNYNQVEHLWGILSSILNCQNIEFLRPLIDYEIYDNKEVEYNYENSSLIFKNTEYKVILLGKGVFAALTIIHNNKWEQLSALCRDLEIVISEMNKV